MTKFYIRMATVKTFSKVEPMSSEQQLLAVVSQAQVILSHAFALRCLGVSRLPRHILACGLYHALSCPALALPRCHASMCCVCLLARGAYRQEFQEIGVRRAEKAKLREITGRYKLKGKGALTVEKKARAPVCLRIPPCLADGVWVLPTETNTRRFLGRVRVLRLFV